MVTPKFQSLRLFSKDHGSLHLHYEKGNDAKTRFLQINPDIYNDRNEDEKITILIERTSEKPNGAIQIKTLFGFITVIASLFHAFVIVLLYLQ